MRHEVIFIVLIVGCANFLFRYLPLRLQLRQNNNTRQRVVTVVLDSIGISAICALLVVSGTPDVLHYPRHLPALLVGFVVLGISFSKTRTIIIPTLLSAVAYGVVWKMMMFL